MEETARPLSAPELTAMSAPENAVPTAASLPAAASEPTAAGPGQQDEAPEPVPAGPEPAPAVPERPGSERTMSAPALFPAEPGHHAELTEEPGDLTGAVPEPSRGPGADRGNPPPELVMTRINGAAR